jgi:hypothetical protein
MGCFPLTSTRVVAPVVDCVALIQMLCIGKDPSVTHMPIRRCRHLTRSSIEWAPHPKGPGSDCDFAPVHLTSPHWYDPHDSVQTIHSGSSTYVDKPLQHLHASTVLNGVACAVVSRGFCVYSWNKPKVANERRGEHASRYRDKLSGGKCPIRRGHEDLIDVVAK